jgi:hypothetical protein
VQFTIKWLIGALIIGLILGAAGMLLWGKCLPDNGNAAQQIRSNTARIDELSRTIKDGFGRQDEQFTREIKAINGVSNQVGTVGKGIDDIAAGLTADQGKLQSANDLIREQQGINKAVREQGPIRKD